MSALRQTDLDPRPERPVAVPAVRSRGPIHVAGMARAGTSWVAEMLRAAGGFVHLNEPFNPKRPPGQSPGILNASVQVGYIYVAEHNAAEFRPALHDTFRFRYRHLAELRQNRSGFDLAKMAKYSSAFAMGALRRKRALLDDPYASLAAPWIAEEFDGQVALLVRHPAAMVASYRKLGYRAHFRHFLDQPQLMADYLEPWRADMEALVETDDRVAQVATFWTMLHRVLADMADRSDRLHVVRYEDLCADPAGEFERLFTRMGLEFNDAARAEVVRGTEGSSKNQSHAWRVSRRGGLSRTAFRPMDSRSMIWAWKDKISPGEAARIRAIAGPVAERFYGDADW
ncbi:MAG TPA: sulfotransferase [Acidimicrobiia bacterium]